MTSSIILIINLFLAFLILALAGAGVAYLFGRHLEQIKSERMLKDVWKEAKSQEDQFNALLLDARERASQAEAEILEVSDVIDRVLENLDVPSWDDKTTIAIRVQDIADLSKITEKHSSLELEDMFGRNKKPDVVHQRQGMEEFKVPPPQAKWRCPCGKMHQFYETGCNTCSMSRPANVPTI